MWTNPVKKYTAEDEWAWNKQPVRRNNSGKYENLNYFIIKIYTK